MDLNRIVAEFVGWTELHDQTYHSREDTCYTVLEGRRPGGVHNRDEVPDYTASLDAWHSDVWPLLGGDKATDLIFVWLDAINEACGGDARLVANASARQRCEALAKVLASVAP